MMMGGIMMYMDVMVMVMMGVSMMFVCLFCSESQKH